MRNTGNRHLKDKLINNVWLSSSNNLHDSLHPILRAERALVYAWQQCHYRRITIEWKQIISARYTPCERFNAFVIAQDLRGGGSGHWCHKQRVAQAVLRNFFLRRGKKGRCEIEKKGYWTISSSVRLVS